MEQAIVVVLGLTTLAYGVYSRGPLLIFVGVMLLIADLFTY